METSPQGAQDTRLRLLLVCALLGAYLLVYVGAPTSVDGDAILAVAVSAVEHGGVDIDSIGYTQWTLLPIGRMGAVGEDGALYSKKGPTPSLALLLLVALAHALPDVSNRAAGVLLNPLVTAATALVLYGMARRLNYAPYTALALGLVFGLATMALAYSKTLFGEPLAMLLLTIAAAYTVRYWQTGRAWSAAVVGAALGLAVGVNTVYAVMIPVVGLFVVYPSPSPLPASGEGFLSRLRAVIAFSLPIAICGAGLLLYNWLRFGAPLETGYHFAEGEGFTTPFFGGLYGLFLSPYRGLLWYNPILVLSVPAWFLLRRQSARLAWLILALVALQGALFAGWWAWDGGIVWGPRFLLPVVPLMVLCLAPLIERAWKIKERATGQSPLQWVIGGIVTLSFVVQLLGALYPYYPHINELISEYWVGIEPGRVTPYTDDVLVNPALSAIVGHWRLFLEGYPLHAAWTKPEIDVVHLAAALALIALGVVFASVRWQRPRALWTIAVVGIFASMTVVAARQQLKPGQQPITALENAMQPSGAGVVLATTQLLEGRTVDIGGGSHVISMNAPTESGDPQAQQVWDYARRLALDEYSGRLWMLSWFGVGDAANWQERWLWQNASFVEQHTIDSEADEPHRAALFDLSPAPDATEAGGWNFGPITLDAYGIATDNDGVRITMQWVGSEAPDGDYAWFVHVLDADGNIVAQQDRAPQGGYAPTGSWTVGEPVIDRLVFPLSAGTDTAGWSLRIGWVDIMGQRLAVTDREGAVVDDGFVIVQF